MMNKINILFLFLMSAFLIVACEEEEEPFTGPYRLVVAGPHDAIPGEQAEFSLNDIANPESYSWTVEGPAQIVGESTGNTITVQFNEPGDVEITASNGSDATGSLTVAVAEVEPAVSVELDSTGVLRSGVSDTVMFSFDAPLASAPTLLMDNTVSEFVSGTLSGLTRVDDQTYYAVYTAGEGNGTPQALLTGIQTTPMFGGVTIDSAFVDLYRVDNIDPIADLSYSSEGPVNDSTVVTVTATFSEPVIFENPADSALYISFEGANVQAQRDTLNPTDDPLVYTYEYTVNGEGNGPIMVTLENVSDLARNPLATTSNQDGIVVDNIAPGIGGSATDEGDFASVTITSNERGTGMYLILEADEEAPATVEEFMEAEGVASGSVEISTAELLNYSGTANEIVVEEGAYTVYYLVQDAAGNYSEMESSSLTMD